MTVKKAKARGAVDLEWAAVVKRLFDGEVCGHGIPVVGKALCGPPCAIDPLRKLLRRAARRAPSPNRVGKKERR